MNHFIKVGTVIMNIAHITSVSGSESYLSVCFEAEEQYLNFRDDEAKALLNYFNSIAQDLMVSAEA